MTKVKFKDFFFVAEKDERRSSKCRLCGTWIKLGDVNYKLFFSGRAYNSFHEGCLREWIEFMREEVNKEG